jgi:FKBP-type peptidyl-prolyl cis-trans isomerase FklB
MKKSTLWTLVAVVSLFGASLATAQAPAKAPPSVAPGADPGPAPTPDQIGYLFGLTFGTQMFNAGITNEVSEEAISRGLHEALQGKATTPADQQQIVAFVQSVQRTVVARNQAAAKSFLDRNGKEKGVITTASGLQFKVLAPGDKKAPAIGPTDEVTVEYRGKLLDGSEFDSSYSRGVPTSFPVNGVIKGWQEALVLMKPGAKWQLFIPPDLAYGPNPHPKIPGGSLLIFDVSVVSSKSSNTPAAGITPQPVMPRPGVKQNPPGQ